jgi:two-component system LytT family response regulator
MINCLIIDDEPLAQEVIERYILQTDELRLLQKCSNVMEAFPVLDKQEIDLLFLDIKMPVINGMDFIRSMKKPPSVIFTTAFSEYAIESYEVNAVDYLLKPVTFERFKKSIDKYLKLNTDQVTKEKNYLYIKVNSRLVKLLHTDILWAESMKDYIKIVTKKENYITHLTMKSLTELLPAGLFARVHRSFIVNIAHIDLIGKKELEVNGVKIPLGDNFRDNLKNISL